MSRRLSSATANGGQWAVGVYRRECHSLPSSRRTWRVCRMKFKKMHNCIISNGKNYKQAGYSSCQQLFARSTILVARAQKECLYNSSMFSGGHRQDAQKLHDEQKVHTSIRTDQILEQLKRDTDTDQETNKHCRCAETINRSAKDRTERRQKLFLQKTVSLGQF